MATIISAGNRGRRLLETCTENNILRKCFKSQRAIQYHSYKTNEIKVKIFRQKSVRQEISQNLK